MQHHWFRPVIFILSVCILVGGWFLSQQYVVKKGAVGVTPPIETQDFASPSGASTIPSSIVDNTQQGVSDATQVYPLFIGKNILSVELADTQDTQEKGLSDRESLSFDRGMLFLYRSPARYSFWMKDMRIPLDFIWIDENKKIVDLAHNVSPDTFPQAITPKVPVPFVLEVSAGYSNKNGIAIGDTVDFSQIPLQK